MATDRNYQGGAQSSIPGTPDEGEPGARQAPLDKEGVSPKGIKDPATAPKVDSDFPDDADMPLPND